MQYVLSSKQRQIEWLENRIDDQEKTIQRPAAQAEKLSTEPELCEECRKICELEKRIAKFEGKLEGPRRARELAAFENGWTKLALDSEKQTALPSLEVDEYELIEEIIRRWLASRDKQN